MELKLHLPGQSLAVDVELAKVGVDLGLQHLHGQLAAASAPAHAHNPCDAAGCTYLGRTVIDGVTWLIYLCSDGMIEYYMA